MSSAPKDPAPSRLRPAAARSIRGLSWGILLAVLAASGAGLLGLAWHAPGSAAREELTYAGDQALGARLDAATAELEAIAADVEQLAGDAKTALEEVTSVETWRLEAALQQGGAVALAIDRRARALRDDLADLPGDEPDARLRYSNATLVRRAAVLTAIDSALGLAANWQAVSTRAADTSRLTALIEAHDTTVVAAAQLGVAARYRQAVSTIDEALGIITRIEELRARLIAEPSGTVLDEWIERTQAYDVALSALYEALRKAKGDPLDVEVQSARREERAAYDNLPPDRRTILVIISEVTRGGLTQAVLAIDDASGRLDEALADIATPSITQAPG